MRNSYTQHMKDPLYLGVAEFTGFDVVDTPENHATKNKIEELKRCIIHECFRKTNQLPFFLRYCKIKPEREGN